MEEIARSFGASKTTLYRHYGSKAGLLHATMDRATLLLMRPLAEVDTDLLKPPEEVLRAFGRILQANGADPAIRALWRAISEAREDFGRAIGPDVARHTALALSPLTTYLASLAEAKRIVVHDPFQAASAFNDLVIGGVTAFLGDPPPESLRPAALDFAIKLFLHGITAA